MSRCDLRIVFDRPDRPDRPYRTYGAGDEITGVVHVEVNSDVRCDGLKVEHFWQTHGRGNTATGPKQTEVLFQGNWQAGQSYTYPFRFVAPEGPPTYHGTYLNVDHYVHARVDVPWAIDPKRKEEYLLLPGEGDYGNLPSGKAAAAHFFGQFASAWMVIGAVLVVAGVVLMVPCGIPLIVIGIILLAVGSRKSLAQRRVGDVRLHFDSIRVAPGGNVPLRLSFTPRQSSAVNGITAKLLAVEQCVSGSGTNRSTHTHKLYEQTFSLAPQGQLVAGQPIDVRSAVPIPPGGAYSFSASDNELIWSVEVRIDVPLWPDWVQKQVLVVRPGPIDAAFAEEPKPLLPPDALEIGLAAPIQSEVDRMDQNERTSATVGLSGEATMHRSPSASSEDSAAAGHDSAGATTAFNGEATLHQSPPPEPPHRAAPPEPKPHPRREPPAPAPKRPPGVPPTDSELLDMLSLVSAASRYGSERDRIVHEYADRRVRCVVVIDSIERTFSYAPDERYRNGRTVIGILRGTDCEAALLMPQDRNDEIDALSPGDTFHADGLPIKWNNIYDRLEVQGE